MREEKKSVHGPSLIPKTGGNKRREKRATLRTLKPRRPPGGRARLRTRANGADYVSREIPALWPRQPKLVRNLPRVDETFTRREISVDRDRPQLLGLRFCMGPPLAEGRGQLVILTRTDPSGIVTPFTKLSPFRGGTCGEVVYANYGSPDDFQPLRTEILKLALCRGPEERLCCGCANYWANIFGGRRESICAQGREEHRPRRAP